MAEYIDREALGICKANRDIFDDPKYADGWNSAISIIQQAPAADVEEVVRCKNCLYWQDNNGGYPHEDCRWGKGETPDADDFCSYGERREKNVQGEG